MDRNRGGETGWGFPIRFWKCRVSQKNDVGDASTSQGLPWYFLPSYIPPGWSGCLVDSLEEIGKPSQMLHSITWLFVSQCPICKANVTQPLQKLNLSKSSAKVDVVNITTPDSQLLYYGWNLLSCLELTLIPLVFFTGIDRYHFGVWHTVTYHLPILQYHGYLTGILPPGEHNFYCFETLFFSNLIKIFSSCHTVDATEYGSASHAWSSLLTIKWLSTPTPILQQNQVSCSSIS